MVLLARPRGRGFDRAVVRDQRNDPGLGDPVEDPLVAPVERGARVGGERRGVGVLVHAEDHPVVAGGEADQIALPDLDLVFVHDPHQLVITDEFLAAAEWASRSIMTPLPWTPCAAMFSMPSAVAPT